MGRTPSAEQRRPYSRGQTVGPPPELFDLFTVTGVPDDAAPRPVQSWRAGQYVWPNGRTKLVLLGGLSTRTGDAERSFSGLARFLAERGGYDVKRDIVEGSYTGVEVNGVWRPSPYSPLDTHRPLIDAAEAFANCLDWYRDALPADARLCVLGYSLGGVVGLDGATLAVARDRHGWRGRLGAVVTLAAPLRGCSVGAVMNWAWLVTGDLDGLGAAGRDLDARWADAEEQTRLERRAAFLRSQDVRVLTLVDPDDSVVRPEESLLPAAGESLNELQVRARLPRPGSLGHGGILDEPVTWQRVLGVVGPQTQTGAAPQVDPVDAELAALKARLRKEGRIK